MSIREAVAEFVEDALFCDGYDDCVIGVVERFGMEPIVLYDREKMLKKMVKADGMSRDEAEEHFSFNVIGAWVGDKTPAFMTKINPARPR